jgi:hypothetical protein
MVVATLFGKEALRSTAAAAYTNASPLTVSRSLQINTVQYLSRIAE